MDSNNKSFPYCHANTQEQAEQIGSDSAIVIFNHTGDTTTSLFVTRDISENAALLEKLCSKCSMKQCDRNPIKSNIISGSFSAITEME